MKHAALVLAALLAATPAAHAAVRVDGATFPDTMEAAGRTLALNGVGTRVFFHLVDGYATALYLPRPEHSAEAIATAPAPKVIMTVFLHAASLAQIRDETAAIHRHFCAHATCAPAQEASYAQFVAHMQPARAGEVELAVVTDTGVEIRRDDRPVVTIPDPTFGANLVLSLVGPAAPTAGYRRGIIGEGRDG